MISGPSVSIRWIALGPGLLSTVTSTLCGGAPGGVLVTVAVADVVGAGVRCGADTGSAGALPAGAWPASPPVSPPCANWSILAAACSSPRKRSRISA